MSIGGATIPIALETSCKHAVQKRTIRVHLSALGLRPTVVSMNEIENAAILPQRSQRFVVIGCLRVPLVQQFKKSG